MTLCAQWPFSRFFRAQIDVALQKTFKNDENLRKLELLDVRRDRKLVNGERVEKGPKTSKFEFHSKFFTEDSVLKKHSMSCWRRINTRNSKIFMIFHQPPFLREREREIESEKRHIAKESQYVNRFRRNFILKFLRLSARRTSRRLISIDFRSRCEVDELQLLADAMSALVRRLRFSWLLLRCFLSLQIPWIAILVCFLRLAIRFAVPLTID